MPKNTTRAIATPLAFGAQRDAAVLDLRSRLAARLRRTIRAAVMAAARPFGAEFHQDTPDRMVLENTIFPFYQLSREHSAIVFVGCDWYTAGYARRMSHKQYATIDPDPLRARFGALRHQIAPMSRLGDAHPEGSLDLVLCNGVIGWGLDDAVEAERSFDAAWTALRPGGHLVVGWNDVARHMPFALDEVAALRRFDRVVFPPLGLTRHVTDDHMRHTFEFLEKPAA